MQKRVLTVVRVLPLLLALVVAFDTDTAEQPDSATSVGGATHSLLPNLNVTAGFALSHPSSERRIQLHGGGIAFPATLLFLVLNIGLQVSNALGWSNHARGARCALIGGPNTRSHIIIAATSGPVCHQRWPYSRCATSPVKPLSDECMYRLRRPWGATSKGKLRHWRRWRALTNRTVAIPALSNRALHDRA